MFYILHDNERYNLPDMTYEYFTNNVDWLGVSDMAYLNYIRDNNQQYLNDFSDDTLKEAELIFEDEDCKLIYKLISIEGR